MTLETAPRLHLHHCMEHELKGYTGAEGYQLYRVTSIGFLVLDKEGMVWYCIGLDWGIAIECFYWVLMVWLLSLSLSQGNHHSLS